MIKTKTLQKIKEQLKDIKKSGLSVSKYFKNLNKSPQTLYCQINALKKEDTEEAKELLDLYDSIKSKTPLDTDDKMEASIIRDGDEKVIGYYFKVYRRDKTPVTGTLSRDEMQTIYRLYSYYGASITQREVSRHFPDYSLQDFKRILRAFNITKASGPFAPHMYEEFTEEELKERHLREKENDFLKKIEKDELNDVRNTAVKLARRNRELEDQLSLFNNIKVDLTGYTPPERDEPIEDTCNKDLVLFLSDMHIGARCESYTLYPNEWNENELTRRLMAIGDKLSAFGHLNSITLCLMGDNLDGMDNQTARRDHIMPQNMDNMEQIETFLRVMIPFIGDLRRRCNLLQIYSVKEGNHDGITGYTATLALKYLVEKTFNDINFTLFKEFFGSFKLNTHVYCLCHGKDSKFMKKPMPLDLNDKTKVMIYEWLENNGIRGGENVHIVKGDLHSNALSSCNLFDYRNVLSLFGGSDYSNYNYSRNAYGVSYDLFINGYRTSGTFENL